jgi:hypothetical protein
VAGGAADPESTLRELRAALANLRAAAEAMAVSDAPARGGRRRKPATAPSRELLGVVVEEADRASRALERLAAGGSGGPAPHPSRGLAVRRLVAEIARRARTGSGFEVASPGGVAAVPDATVAAGAIVDAVLGVLARLRRDHAVGSIELSARRHEGLVALDLAFRAREPEASRLREAHAELLAGGPAGEPPLGETARAAGGEAWLAARRDSATFALRVLLPILPARRAGGGTD